MIKGKETIVLVSNFKKAPSDTYKKYMSDNKLLTTMTNWGLEWALKRNGYSVITYTDFFKFVRNIENHRNDIVFPYFSGVQSRNRQSYVQSLCEYYNMLYVGGDTYSQTLANDKVLSKQLCDEAGIATPNCKILFNKNYLPDIFALELPLIVKPQFEGESVGISKAGVFNSYEGVLPYAIQLLEDLGQSIIIETFIEGKEASVAVIGYKDEIKSMGLVMYKKELGKVTDYSSKRTRLPSSVLANELLTPERTSKFIRLFALLDKIEYARFDFIVKDGVFYNIEITAAPGLSPVSYMYSALKDQMSYIEFIGLLVANCKERALSTQHFT